MRWMSLTCLPLLAALWTAPVLADNCQGPIARNAPRAPDGTPITFATLQSGEARVSYIGHSTFSIESPQGIVAATDYNDYFRPRDLPTIATMNHAHSSHFTYRPDPAIKHVLRGWRHEGKSPAFDIRESDMRVRNVATNIRDGDSTEYSGNSIFIFEIGGLCIAHLGHLHHTLTPEHVAAIGQVDILMAAVDGSWTIDLEGMVEIISQLKPKVIIPMHFITVGGLDRFLSRMGGRFPVDRRGIISHVFSLANLPDKTAIMVFEGR